MADFIRLQAHLHPIRIKRFSDLTPTEFNHFILDPGLIQSDIENIFSFLVSFPEEGRLRETGDFELKNIMKMFLMTLNHSFLEKNQNKILSLYKSKTSKEIYGLCILNILKKEKICRNILSRPPRIDLEEAKLLFEELKWHTIQNFCDDIATYRKLDDERDSNNSDVFSGNQYW